jgi:AraC-like DNA-binding protein
MRPSSGRTDRLGVWRDLIRENFVALDIAAEGDRPFSGAVHSTALGHLTVASVDSTTQGCRRTPALARHDSDVYLQVGLVTRGAGLLRQDGREAALRPGDFALYETDRPFFWGLRGDWQLLVLTWPRATVALDQGDSQRLTAQTLGGPGLGRIVGRMLRDVVTAPPELTEPGAVRLADELAELVTTVATERVPAEPPDPAEADVLRRIDAHIDACLADPELGPGAVAAAHFMSTRQLHRLFARRGVTVTRHIRHRRLERCRRDLLDPRAADLSVTDISRRWGFADLATFSRAFRRAYGTTPTAYRARASGARLGN